MIAHPTERMQLPVGLLTHFSHCLDEIVAIHIIEEKCRRPGCHGSSPGKAGNCTRIFWA
jgi:hypothetical protein